MGIASAKGVIGVVLAGGRSRRFGQNKALYPIAGRRMIDRVVEALSLLVDRVVVVANESAGYEGLEVIPDRIADCGPLGGLFSALTATSAEKCLLVACDCPLVEPIVLQTILRRLVSGSCDAVVPWVWDLPQVLQAGYTSRCLPAIEHRILRRQLKMVDLLPEVQVDCVPADEIYAEGGSSWSFFNVNTHEELELAELHLRGEYAGEPPCPARKR